MANLTIYEFYTSPNAIGEVTWPADVTTTGTTSTTVSLSASTRAFIVCADADCHIQINGSGSSAAASAYTQPILSAVANQFRIGPASGQTLKFA